MGRPIKKKFFGNTNIAIDGEGVGGEAVNAVTVTNGGTLYSQGTTVTINAPQIPGGEQATISYSITGAGLGVISASKTTGGSGYTSASLTVNKPATVTKTADATNAEYTLTNVSNVTGIYVGMRADASWGMQANAFVTSIGANSVTLNKTMVLSTASLAVSFSDQGSAFASTVSLTSNRQNAISVTAYLLAKDGGVSAKTADIIKQEAGTRYLVKTADGTGQCKLVASNSPSAGQMYIVATDQYGSTYWVTKLTAHRARLTQRSMSGQYEFVTNAIAGWTLGSASVGIVSITNA